MNEEQSEYKKYRGKCKQMSEELVAADPTLVLVRGYYYCTAWGKQQHWWVKRQDGTIIDPTKDQFPSRGMGRYEEFDGRVECNNCGKETTEDEALFASHYVFCSNQCYMHFVGVD